MNQHLSEQQIDEWLLNLCPAHRPADVEAHLRSCPACSDEVARVADSLTLFGGAVRNWSEEQLTPVRAAWRITAAPAWGWQIGLAIAALCLLILVPVYRHRQATQQAARITVEASAQDELLLRQVEREIARSVPAPMEPLAKLMPNDVSR
jgi:anti-sigma factor RsiW